MLGYERIRYFVDGDGNVWHGPFCPADKVHYKKVKEAAVGSSELPTFAVEITPRQAAEILERDMVRPWRDSVMVRDTVVATFDFSLTDEDKIKSRFGDGAKSGRMERRDSDA